MQKSQFLLALLPFLALTASSVEAIGSPGPCLKKCSSDADYCYQYNRDHNTNQPCLSLYYVCLGACELGGGAGGRPKAVDEPAVAADDLAAAVEAWRATLNKTAVV